MLSISQQVQAACAQNTYVPTTTTYNGGTYATPVVANTSLLNVGLNSYIISDAGTLIAVGTGTSMTTTYLPKYTTAVGPPGQTLPAFSPTTFPSVGGTDQTIKNGTLAAGSYGKVTIDSSATFSGGNYYISEILTKGDGDTLTMAAGNYFVDKWNAGNNFILIVSSGPVKIYTRTSFQVGNESAFNVSGSTANLQIYGYDGIQIQFGNANSSNSNIDFNGLLYVPGSNTNISFGNNNVIQGSILSGGGVQLGNNTGVIYDAATQAAIASIPIASSGNGSAVCYYELSGQPSGLTCAAHTLTIKACTDTSIPCATPYTGGASGTLSAAGTGMTVNWDGTTGGATGAGFVIPGGSSTVTKNVQVATAGSVVFGVTSANPAPANAANCTFGSPMCSFTAQTAGFIFSNTTTGNGYTIPAQVSGVAPPALYLRAVQASTTNPAVCTPAIIGQTTAVNMGYVCNNPSSCQAGNLATINATAIAPSGTAVSLSFDGNGSAPITVRYDDVGQITLNASKTVVPFGGATAVTLNGSSNAFVVRPHHFDLSAIMQTAVPHLVNPAAADAAGARFVKAGEQFSVTVTAKNALGGTTANYGRETVPENVKLTSSLVTGLGLTINPPLNGAFGSFTNGVATGTAFTWDEVGIITLTPCVLSANYLGASDVCGTASGNVGRFYPDHFDTEATGTMTCTGLTFNPACPAGGLVYSGQPFASNVTARNLAGWTTANYETANGFARSVTLQAWDAQGSIATQNPGPGSFSNSLINSGFTSGVASTLTTTYSLNAVLMMPTNIHVRAVDSDNVSSRRASLPATSVEGGVKVASGRVSIPNAYGSELLPLTLNANAQYYDGTSWVKNLTDSQTILTLAGHYNLVKDGTTTGATIPASSGAATMASGTISIILGPPAGGATGTATINPSVPAYMTLIPGSATFGVFGGRNEFIYRGRHGR